MYRCQLPLRFAIFVLLNSHLECFFSASKIAIFFSVRYATNRLPHARVTKQKTVNLLPLRFAIFVLLNSHLECFFSASKIAIFFSVRYATNRLPHARVTKQKTVNLNLTALIFTHVKLTISYFIHIENHCALIYRQ